MDFKTLVTRAWPEVDIICTGIPRDELEAKKIRLTGKRWWIYSNEALTTKNRAYTRYVFGFGVWRLGVDGVVAWTFQMTQGCSGNPFTVLDGSELMVAYPGVSGNISTPTREVIREGINDYKYIFQLESLIFSAEARGHPKAVEIERRLQQLKKNLGQAPRSGENLFSDWQPYSFAKRRKQIVEWALELLPWDQGS